MKKSPNLWGCTSTGSNPSSSPGQACGLGQRTQALCLRFPICEVGIPVELTCWGCCEDEMIRPVESTMTGSP